MCYPKTESYKMSSNQTVVLQQNHGNVPFTEGAYSFCFHAAVQLSRRARRSSISEHQAASLQRVFGFS